MLVYCPSCGSVYMQEYANGCDSPSCNDNDTWYPPPMKPVVEDDVEVTLRGDVAKAMGLPAKMSLDEWKEYSRRTL